MRWKQVQTAGMAKNKSRRNPKTVLRLPDLEQSKSAVLTSLTSPCRRLLLVSPARCIGSASGEGVHGHDGFPMRRLGLSCPEVGQGNCLGEIQSKGCAWQTPSRRRRNACRFAIALPNRVRVLNRLGISRFRRGNRSRPRGYPGRGSDWNAWCLQMVTEPRPLGSDRRLLVFPSSVKHPQGITITVCREAV
jgi:hypothetical protein